MDKIQKQKSQSPEPLADNETLSALSQINPNDPEIETLRTENTELRNSLLMREERDERDEELDLAHHAPA